tara:strand:- start:150 stop:3611 length:3462 start_codon:yes stop_codon:yes gene_type:complete
MKVRLVAYRKATSASTSDSTYNLDLQDEPNISLNFQFADVKEPETRKASFSQTFKLPFTDNNNDFFQNWYNVNLETLVFSTRTKFDAVLYIGTVSQMEGSLQLKSVYQKAQYYEVVLMSNTATLFNVIGDNRLKDVFLNDDGSYSVDFNHIYDQNTLARSWDGTSSAFVNEPGGVSLRDTTVDVQKIMYPMSVTEPRFYYDPEEDSFLNMSQANIDSLSWNASYQLTVKLNQFRPAIQLKTLLKLIIARAGFSYSSEFIDGDYFGKLFMTTGNHLEASNIPTVNPAVAPSGLMYVANDSNWGSFTINGCINEENALETEMVLPDNTPYSSSGIPFDGDNVWNTSQNYFTKLDSTMENITFAHNMYWSNITTCGTYTAITYWIQQFDPTTGELVEDSYYTGTATALYLPYYGDSGYLWIEHTLSIQTMPVGAHAKILLRAYGIEPANPALNGTFRFGGVTGQSFTGTAVINWLGYSNLEFGGTVDLPACIDPSLKQKDFLKDIIQRFNLLIVSDPDNATNLIIEPYNDYLANGELKHWTDKIDTSKEILVKDTTSLQKKVVSFSDQEDEDLNNKVLKENFPEVNVFGKIKITDWSNEFAKGELKNNPIFSPYINDMVYRNADVQYNSHIENMTVQYEFTFEGSGNDTANPIKKTKPKLFFYNGQATPTQDGAGNSITYYLHISNSVSESIVAYSLNLYPVCTPFDIDTNTATYELSTTTQSLYWNSTPPLVGSLLIFSSANTQGNWFNGSLYGKYWRDYLNSIYSTEARIMEVYINLNAVDIFQFKFNDEIFIKDTYWRILEIKNYQVGAKASTKVTLIKSLDTKENCPGCSDVLGSVDGIGGGANFVGDPMTGLGAYIWCPEDDPTCTPTITGTMDSLYTSPECCDCNGGYIMWSQTANADEGKYPCLTYAGSPPVKITNKQGVLDIFKSGQVKGLATSVLGGENKPFVIGSANNKYNTALLPYYKDDYVIKYKTKKIGMPQLEGESHKIILIGNTSGTTRGYAYPKGESYGQAFRLPLDVNIIIRVKGIVTVVGGKNTTYILGSTEAFAYYTAFKIVGSTTLQLGTVGGQQDFSIREGVLPTTCTLHIDIDAGILRFGLDDSQTDTERVWELSVEMDINRMVNLGSAYNEEWALFQNGQRIQFENYVKLIWN